MNILGFLIYYGDESVVKGYTKEDWLVAPQENVQVVVQVYDQKYRQYFGTTDKRIRVWRHFTKKFAYEDYYWMDNEGKIGAGSAKLTPENITDVKLGKEIDKELFRRIYSVAVIDPEEGSI